MKEKLTSCLLLLLLGVTAPIWLPLVLIWCGCHKHEDEAFDLGLFDIEEDNDMNKKVQYGNSCAVCVKRTSCWGEAYADHAYGTGKKPYLSTVNCQSWKLDEKVRNY